MECVIVDGDWGGDEMQLAAVLLAHPQKVKIIGCTATFGNTDHDNVLKNCGNILALLNAKNVKYYPGAQGPSDREMPKGDNAHSADGIGGVIIPQTDVEPEVIDAVDFILKTLANEPANTITITATGPLTNIARAYRKDPETMRRVKQIIVMGGCTESLPAHDMASRRGNITLNAEFNFYMAPTDAHDVMLSDLPIVLFPMNCTQQLAFDTEREKILYNALSDWPDKRDAIIAMMKAPAALDKMKFNSAPFMHDVHTALYIVAPEIYEPSIIGNVKVFTDTDLQGHSDFTVTPKGNIDVMQAVDADAAFDIVADSLIQRCQF